MTPIGRLADEPYRLTDALDATTHVAEYSFLADAGDLVTVTASPLSSADLFLTLHADDAVGMSPGLQVAFGDDASASTRDPAINAVVPASGTYRITVAARAEFGLAPVASQFRLTASRQASSFTVPAGASGRAGGHAFTIAQSGVLDVTFGSAQWQPTAQPQLFDAAGTVIASAGLPDGSGRARLSQYVTPGDYVISNAMPLARDTAVSMRFAGVSALQSPWGPQAAGEDPSFLVLADVDGDTLEDLVVANPTRQRGSDVISVMLGRPQGRFADRQEFEVPGGVEAGLQVRDINGDNMPDLVALGTDDGGAGSVGTVSVLFGRGDGTFSPAIATPLDGRPKAAAIADFDGDGFLDAAVATGGIVSVLRGNRDGRFVADRTYDSGLDSIGSLLVAAMDRDGRADLVMVGRRAAGHAMAVVRGERYGAFTPTPALLLDFRAGMTIAPDLDQDGVSDVVVVNETAGTVDVFLGMGDGSVAARRTLTVGATPTAVAAGKVDDDDLMDLVVTCSTARGVYLLPGSGGGAFRQPRVVGGGPRPGVVAIADVDDDGRTDLVYRDLGLDSVRFIIQGPGGTFDE